MNIQSGRLNFVIVNVHLEPKLTLRQLRGRLQLTHTHCSSYPNGVGIILGDFNICDPEERRLHVWTQIFTDWKVERFQDKRQQRKATVKFKGQCWASRIFF